MAWLTLGAGGVEPDRARLCGREGAEGRVVDTTARAPGDAAKDPAVAPRRASRVEAFGEEKDFPGAKRLMRGTERRSETGESDDKSADTCASTRHLGHVIRVDRRERGGGHVCKLGTEREDLRQG